MLDSTPHAHRSWFIVLCSALAAALTLATALWSTRDSDAQGWRGTSRMFVTPERAAESFIHAYRTGAFTRAAELASGELARSLRLRKPRGAADTPSDRQAFVVQESHRLDEQRLRLVGVLVEENQDESQGTPVSLTLCRHEKRYVVEDIQW